MREIKFRGMKGGKWVYGGCTSYLHSPKEKRQIVSSRFFEGQEEKEHYIFIDVKEETIGQYTGLKDKKGIEIYEGDRVKIRRHLVEGRDYIDYNCDVKFGTYCYCLFIADKQLWGLDPIVARECEVIGNIYEKQLLNSEP